MSPRTKRGLFVAIFVSSQAILVILLLEVAIRVLSEHNEKVRILSYNARFADDYENVETLEDLIGKTHWGFRPLTVSAGFKSNSKSFRTREYSEDKTPGTYRILTIGDSFTYASGSAPYAKHWPALLEATLWETVSTRIELINLGIAAVGPRFELRLWQLEGAKLDADLVIVGFCIGTDFTDESKMSLPEASFVDRIADESYLVRIVRNFLLYKDSEAEIEKTNRQINRHGSVVKTTPRPEEKGGYEVPGYRYDPNDATFSRRSYPEIVSRRMGICKRSTRESFDASFAEVTAVLLDFHRQVTSSGADFLLMMIPEEYQVNEKVFESGLGFRSPPSSRRTEQASDYDIPLPQRQLTEFCESHRIDYLDLLPVFQRRGKSTRLYKLRDTHWNLEGNALAAELLAERFQADFAKLFRKD